LAKSAEERVFDYLRKLEGVEELSPSGHAGLLRLAQHLQDISQGTTPWLALSRFLFDRSDYVRTVLSGQTPSDELRRVAVRQLLDLLRNMPSHGRGSPISRALNRIRHMILLSDERDLDLWRICRERGEIVLADVHTHPGGAGQSESDRMHPMIAEPGHVALIVPRFAMEPVRLGEIGLYRYLGGFRWDTPRAALLRPTLSIHG
jgi:proteasome lid subunit RPN8/RPN11